MDGMTLTNPSILVISLGGADLRETPQPKLGLSNFLPSPLSLQEISQNIYSASDNALVKGIILKIEGESIGFSQIEEIHEALTYFKSKGKKVYAFADTFGENNNSMKSYFLALGADEIWVQPSGLLNINGLMAEIPFFKKILDQYKIKPIISKREEYKSYPNSMLEGEMTKPQKENIDVIFKEILKLFSEKVQAARKIPLAEIKHLVDHAPYESHEAVKLKIIDKVGFLSDLKESIKKTIQAEKNKDLQFITLKQYIKNFYIQDEKDRIGVIELEGTIMRATSESGQYQSATDVGFKKSLDKALKDKSTKAIILRINSGGGSAVASETIWHDVIEAKKIKPIIVSISDVAASGACLIFSAANKVVGYKSSFTGSIGVFSGKIVTQDFWNSFGINWDSHMVGENAGIWSSSKGFNPEEFKKFNQIIDTIYLTFKQKVSQGRNIPMDDVQKLAKGYVWTGLQAKERKLIDEIGGFNTAIDVAKKEAKLSKETPVSIVNYSPNIFMLDGIFDLLGTEDRIQILFQKALGTIPFSDRTSMITSTLKGVK